VSRGYFALVLHSHLPYVRHPEHAYFLEEQWFFEAMTETYIPLLHAFEAMRRDDVDFRLTLSISAPLLGMMRDTLLLERYAAQLDRQVELGDREIHVIDSTSASMGAFMDRFFQDDVLEAVQRLRPIADGLGLTMAQLALAWVLRRPEVASAIVGASRPEQVSENAAASGVELDEDTLRAIGEALGRA
jgi:hypothetical protein